MTPKQLVVFISAIIAVLIFGLAQVVFGDEIFTPEQEAKYQAHVAQDKINRAKHDEAVKAGDPEALHREAAFKHYSEKATEERHKEIDEIMKPKTIEPLATDPATCVQGRDLGLILPGC